MVEAHRVTEDGVIGDRAYYEGWWKIFGVEFKEYAIPHDVFMASYEPGDEEATEYLDGVKHR
jgi:hypothetical protein